MKLTTKFGWVWLPKGVVVPPISLGTKRIGVNVTCPLCNNVGKIFVIVYPMIGGKQIVFRGKKRCRMVYCQQCQSNLIVSLNCLGSKCENKVRCLQMGIITINVDHLRE